MQMPTQCLYTFYPGYEWQAVFEFSVQLEFALGFDICQAGAFITTSSILHYAALKFTLQHPARIQLL